MLYFCPAACFEFLILLFPDRPFAIAEGKNKKWYTYLPDDQKGRVQSERTTQKAIESLVVDYWRQQEENPTIILIKGNKEYCPATCCIDPHCINTLFLTGKKNRGDLPIGIHYDNEHKRYRAAMSYQGIQIKIGSFRNAEDVFNRYKVYKEDFIQDIAEQYKGKIPDKMYQAMMNWKIEVTD